MPPFHCLHSPPLGSTTIWQPDVVPGGCQIVLTHSSAGIEKQSAMLQEPTARGLFQQIVMGLSYLEHKGVENHGGMPTSSYHIG